MLSIVVYLNLLLTRILKAIKITSLSYLIYLGYFKYICVLRRKFKFNFYSDKRGLSMDNYAIISAGSKQYTVSAGDTIRIESTDKEKGEEITFKPLMLKNSDGLLIKKQALQNISVTGTVVRNGRAKKIIVFKMKRRKDERKKRGHRQNFTEVRITAIS